VVHQVLPPGVEYGQEADLRTQMLWVGSDHRRNVSDTARNRMS
jgi:hypothetical protein